MNSLGGNVVTAMRDHYPFLKTKPALKAQILYSIGEDLMKGSFKSCSLYLKSAQESLRHWLKKYTIDYCNTGEPTNLVILATKDVEPLFTHVKKLAEQVSISKESKNKEWLETFHAILTESGRLELTKIQLFQYVKLETCDISNFEEELMAALQQEQSKLEKEFEGLKASEMKWEIKPFDIFYNELSGCTEQCPFCKEQCDLTNADHSSKHSVTMHRPQGLGGLSHKMGGKMTLETCTSLIGSDKQFRVNEKYHSFRKYSKYYPKWEIKDDKSLKASLFWKWLLANYSHRVEVMYDVKRGEDKILDEWKTLTWEMVKKELLE